jgi:hypothetical protein
MIVPVHRVLPEIQDILQRHPRTDVPVLPSPSGRPDTHTLIMSARQLEGAARWRKIALSDAPVLTRVAGTPTRERGGPIIVILRQHLNYHGVPTVARASGCAQGPKAGPGVLRGGQRLPVEQEAGMGDDSCRGTELDTPSAARLGLDTTN